MFSSDCFLSLGYDNQVCGDFRRRLFTKYGVRPYTIYAAISTIFLMPKVVYEPFHTNTVPKYTFRARTIMSSRKNKMLDPESNTGSANYALAVLDQLNYLTTFLSWHY